MDLTAKIVQKFDNPVLEPHFTEAQVLEAAHALELVDDATGRAWAHSRPKIDDTLGVALFVELPPPPLVEFRHGEGMMVANPEQLATLPDAIDILRAVGAVNQVCMKSVHRYEVLRDFARLGTSSKEVADVSYRQSLMEALQYAPTRPSLGGGRHIISNESHDVWLHRRIRERVGPAGFELWRRRAEDSEAEAQRLAAINKELDAQVVALTKLRDLPMAVNRPMEPGTYLLEAGEDGRILESYKVSPEAVVALTQAISSVTNPGPLGRAWIWLKNCFRVLRVVNRSTRSDWPLSSRRTNI